MCYGRSLDGEPRLMPESRVTVTDANLVLGRLDAHHFLGGTMTCLLYTSAAADERSRVELGGRGTIKKKK